MQSTRIEQLQQCVNELTSNGGSYFRLLAGDLNLRDNELNSVHNMYKVKDAWIQSGKQNCYENR